MPSAQSIELSIVIVTWNGRRFVSECLDSLSMFRDDRSVEIVVVDNASSDGTPEAIEQEFPWVSLIRSSANLGFAKANNIGLASSTGKYLCLVNSDVKVPKNCLTAMQGYMEENLDVGMLGPQMLCPNGLIGRSYMRFPTAWRSFCDAFGLHRVLGGSKHFNGVQMSDFNNSHTADVDVLNGWLLMVRREALINVGPLDEQFFMYGEDIDWSYRFHKCGWKRVYFAGANAFHYGGGSSAAAPTRFYIEMKRANLQLCRKHYGTIGYLTYFAIVCVHEVIRVLGYTILSVFGKKLVSDSTQKTKRSITCVRWLFGSVRLTDASL